ncbi:MAG: hypothetical protein A3F47_00560 [Candidatus Staskawiczbacteria bacterium RIFCSPHIGHO2_12_FULL_38_11]|uniref:HAMP domain-containing protein n=1 Tax=Candidatus Staskawiczbacteria bacterium RIFCSPHIGHO2_12_FULL_38_11 TaxID=1802209 RepID=A0A1G2I9I7_9BACT|nr:MAG: hypothetical protein A3F47_00560 [Candidatus Staskawiczbacteria bacterium RIFCSPHIGHO2_12_FULL_38_11]
MLKISFKIAYPIILAGLFVIVAFIGFNYENLNLSFYIIFLLLTIYIFLFGFATGQQFSKPVKELLQKADNLSKGDLKSRFYLENKDELGELARVFNKIADDFEQSKNQNENMERAVDIKVKARTQALDETINALEQKVKNRTLELQRIGSELEKFKDQPKEEEILELKERIKDLKKELNGRKNKKEVVAEEDDTEE